MKRDNCGGFQDNPPSKFQRPEADLSNVIVRFLIPRRAAGIMIGRGGENIKKIRAEFKNTVKLNIPDSRGPERTMTVEGALDKICKLMLDSFSKLKDIMNAKLSDPKRIMGNNLPRRRGQNREDPERDDEEDSNMIDLRILVHESQAGSVIGRGGDRIKDLRNKYKMRVIKVYQMLAPNSTDRVVQMVADPENVVQCLKSVIEAVESAPPRGAREDYDAANFSEADALNYGGWLSNEAIEALSKGMPIARGPGGMPPMGYGMCNPYMNEGGMGPMQGMGPMGGMGPMPGPMGGMGPMSGGCGPAPVRGSRGGGPGGPGMMGGNVPHQRGMMGPSGGPAPVPPPGGPPGRGPANSSSAGLGAPYGGPGDQSGYGGQKGYDGPGGGFEDGGYGGMEHGQMGQFGSHGYGGSPGGPAGPGYGSGRGDSLGNNQGLPPRGGYGSVGSGMHDGAKINQWYGGWA